VAVVNPQNDTPATVKLKHQVDNLKMGNLYLVRHGQASFGADDYDVLSALGERQAKRLGEYFKYKGIVFDAALTGTLKRQVSTFAGICAGMGMRPMASSWPALNEYDSEAVIHAVHPFKLEKPTTPEMYRSHFRLLKDGLAQWMAGVVSPIGMASYVDFVAGINAALDHVRENCHGNVLLVSSGGPISTAVGQVLGTSPDATIELNLRIRNSSVTEFAFNPKRHMLVSYNNLPHLDAPEHAEWITYA
jgi:broad specificity phosphatase PhoE